MRFNEKQKRTILIGLLMISAALLIWIGFGGEIFTKTQVLIEKQDELLGTTYKEWKNKFVLGLDYTLGFSGLVVFISLIAIWLLRSRKS
jgi:hypothetical protein